jgi:hypothetical protein
MDPRQDGHSHLFLVRFWSGGARDGAGSEWSGRVQHVLSGEACAFDDWPALVSRMLEMAAADGAEGLEAEAPESESMDVSP